MKWGTGRSNVPVKVGKQVPVPWPRSQSIDLGLGGKVLLPLYSTKTGHIALYLKRSLAAVPKHSCILGEIRLYLEEHRNVICIVQRTNWVTACLFIHLCLFMYLFC